MQFQMEQCMLLPMHKPQTVDSRKTKYKENLYEDRNIEMWRIMKKLSEGQKSLNESKTRKQKETRNIQNSSQKCQGFFADDFIFDEIKLADQSAITCSKLTIETLEQGVKYAQS